MTEQIIFTKEQYKERYDSYYNQFFVLEKELAKLNEICHTHTNYHVLVTGVAGCGKTTLIKVLGNKLSTTNLNSVFIQVSTLNENFDLSTYIKQQTENTVFFIDGLDESKNPEKILKQLQHMNRVIITSRQLYSNYIFTDIIRIGRLSKEQCAKLIDSYLGPIKLASEIFEVLVDSSGSLAISLILQLVNEYINNSDQIYDALLKFGSKFSQKYKLGQGLYLQAPELLIPEKPEITIPQPIVEDISIINTSLLTKVAHDPNLIHKCTPRQFEEIVCEMLNKKGYKVNLTNQTRDGGKDIIIVENNLLGSFLVYVECKHYSPERPIGVNLVRELYGTISADEATAGLLITSSYFSKDAINFKNKVKHRISLMDYVQLISEIQKIC